jgi:hypothetical protein
MMPHRKRPVQSERQVFRPVTENSLETRREPQVADSHTDYLRIILPMKPGDVLKQSLIAPINTRRWPLRALEYIYPLSHWRD